MNRPTKPKEQNLWDEFGEAQRRELTLGMRARAVARGETLVQRGDDADFLYIVVFGLFEVRNRDNPDFAAEIGPGQLIGEIGFFAGNPRNADVIALRDSEVMELSRDDFDDLLVHHPAIGGAVTRALAKRLAAVAPSTQVSQSPPRRTHARVVALVGAGDAEIDDEFMRRLANAIRPRSRCRFVRAKDAAEAFGDRTLERYAAASWLAEQERGSDLLIVVADPAHGEWTEAALRSADQALLIAQGTARAPGPLERAALELFPAHRRRLVLVHDRRASFAPSGAAWREGRSTSSIHHVSTEDEADFESLARFLVGAAIGYVASGGGGYGPAHVGVYRAFREAGVVFDMHGGASVGSAMAATFSALVEPETIRAQMQEMFVKRRALKRLTFPVYSLLDHKVFDAELRRQFGENPIEDLWKPYFAVATDLTTHRLRVFREGPLWQAIRASCAVPGVLPPFFDAEGHMLIDGGVMDNLPIDEMTAIKPGPNLIVDLRPPLHQTYDLAYPSIPGRGELLGRVFSHLIGRRRLPGCPGPASVIQESIFGKLREERVPRDPDELWLRLPPFPGSSFMNWDRHSEVQDAAYDWTRRNLDKLSAADDPGLRRMLVASRRST